MEKLRDPKLLGQLRHMLTALGPLLSAWGITEEASWAAFVGAGMAILGFWLSWTAKEKT